MFSFRALIVVGMLALPLSVSAAAATCSYKEIDPNTGKFVIGDIALDLGEWSKASDPTDLDSLNSWEGPISVKHGDGTICHSDHHVGIIERPSL